MIHAVLLAALAALPSLGFVADAAPIDALGRFVGTWHNHGTLVATPYSKPGTVDGVTTCAWSGDRQFVICQQSFTLGSATLHALGIYTYDEAAKAYRFFGVRPDGGSDSEIQVDATSIVYPNAFEDRGTRVLQRTLNVWTSPEHYDFRSEYSTDGGAHWHSTLTGVADRTAP